MIRTTLILAIGWSALAVQPGLSEMLKVAGVSMLAAALASQRATLCELLRQPSLLAAGLVVVMSSWFALDPAAWLGSAARAQGALIALALLVVGAAASRLQPRDRHSIYVAVAVLGGVISAHVLLQRLGLDPLSWQGQLDQRPSATLSNATILAGWLLLVLPLTLALAFIATRRRWIWIALAALQLAALLASGTRSALLSLLLVAACAWVGCGMRSRRAQLALLTAAVVAVVALAALRPASLHDRAYLWRSAATALVAPQALVDLHGRRDEHAWLRPWLGHGCDGQQPALTAAAAGSVGGRAEAAGWTADRAHQGVLDRALEQGVAGIVAALLLLVTVGRALWLGWHSDDHNRRIQSLAIAVALGAWLLHLQASFGLTGDRTLAWVWIGIAFALGRHADGADAVAPAARWQAPTLALAALVASGGLLLGGLAASGVLPAAFTARWAPALQAERMFSDGQQAYLQALAASGSTAAARMRAAAVAFEQAVEQRRYDVDAALAAASARIEAAALSSDAADDLARARAWAAAVRRTAPADPRLGAVDARIASIARHQPAGLK